MIPGPVAVVGAGSWGTALAISLARSGGAVRLWDRGAAQVAMLSVDRENRAYLPGHRLPNNVSPVAALPVAVSGAAMVVLAVPSAALSSLVPAVAEATDPGADWVLATKGLDPETLETPSATVRRLLGAAARSVVSLSGPNLAREVAAGIPTAAVAASPDAAAAERVARRCNQPSFRTYVSNDIVGVETGGAVKNVLAIAAGVSDGLGFGDNTKAALLTRGLGEMARLSEALGGRRETVYGLAGVGDLMATASSRLSRNWRVGEGLALGRGVAEVLADIAQVAEGIPTARAVARLAEGHGLALPVCAAVDDLLAGRITPVDALARLTENRMAGRE
ncbi:MAG: NAD(P)H-dependent glycerol-3-phosphate dehydrogenase [Armatimonadota bacterium]